MKLPEDNAALTPEEIATIDSYNAIAAKWADNHNQPDYWKIEMDYFRSLMPAPGRLLEIGCGGGRDAVELIKMGFDYVGTDISPEFVQITRQRLPKQNVILADIYQMSFSQPFDAFWASAVLLHIPRHRINEALSRIRSVMKPGAIGFISIMDGQGENWRDEDGLPESRRYFTYWTKEAFSDALTASNFGLVAYQYRPQSQRTRWHCFYAKAE